MSNLPLYHGSVAEISEFIPRDGWHAGGEQYNGTLATPLKKYAMLYAMKLKEGFSRESVESALGGTKDSQGVDAKDYMMANHVINGTPCAIIRNRGKFLTELEKAGGGGYLYTLSSDTFQPIITSKGVTTNEYLSQSASVKPTHKERITLDQVMREGCQVLFLKDGIDFDKLYEAHKTQFMQDQGHFDLYQQWVDEGILTSENAIRGIPNELNFVQDGKTMPVSQEDERNWVSSIGPRTGRTKS